SGMARVIHGARISLSMGFEVCFPPHALSAFALCLLSCLVHLLVERPPMKQRWRRGHDSTALLRLTPVDLPGLGFNNYAIILTGAMYRDKAILDVLEYCQGIAFSGVTPATATGGDHPHDVAVLQFEVIPKRRDVPFL